MAKLSQSTLDAIGAAVASALASQPAAPVAASTRVSLSALRSAGTYACGVTGHGKADDGNFATIGGATYHAKTCKAMAVALKAK